MPVWLLRHLPTVLLVVAIGAAAAWAVHALREQGRDELRPRVAQLEQELTAERNNRERAERVANGYYAELQSNLNRPVPVGPVRLCRASPVPAPGPAASGADGPAAASGSDNRPAGGDLEAGPDIGPELFSLARDCDAEIARLRALQRWFDP